MTRAADRLIVCGADGESARPKGCWYDLVREPLQPFLVAEDECGEKVLRYRKPTPGQVAEAAPPPAEAANAADATYRCGCGSRLPSKRRAWCRCRPLRRSRRTSAALLRHAPACAAERRNALARGRIVHRLMQSLPDIPAAGRKAPSNGISRVLRRISFPPSRPRSRGKSWPSSTIWSLPSVRAGKPRRSADRRPHRARRRRPIAVLRTGGPAGGDRRDGADRRLQDRPVVPRRLAEVPQAYVAQLALYRAVLARIYPEKTIRAALIFTDGPDLMEIPAAAMEAALAAIATKRAKMRRSRSGEAALTPSEGRS